MKRRNVVALLTVLALAGCGYVAPASYEYGAASTSRAAPSEAESLWASWCYENYRGDPLRALKANGCRRDGPGRYFRR